MQISMTGRLFLHREGWPLLTVETGVNGDSKSTNALASLAQYTQSPSKLADSRAGSPVT
jgi:hypothetical protein